MPPVVWTPVCRECCMLLYRGRCDGLIPHADESTECGVCVCVCVCVTECDQVLQ